ncbi:aromatic ring-hydroxylating oxygenase subunit alpha [Roseovarius sp. Pro17]|uniref:aromatic ring-hydroxylating oxygenase subunit alpha n=1 Tax=Roseovarius sp. Pro17 TaxID=3108175 RepID=UPI002D7794D0|nr:Rieske 2Fe-2S domain-containing protein [Roseovarius sp. Pro17]
MGQQPRAIDELMKTAALPFEAARAMPPSVYTSEEFLAQEQEFLFGKEWFCVGRASAMQEPGDYVTVELAGQPIAVIRGRDGELRAMSNVCLHRMSTLLEGRGNTRSIVCPYHAWTYNLDGSLRGAPEMDRNDAFCKADYKLGDIRCEEWLGWVYVTLDPDTPPVAQQLAPLADMIGDYGMENYVETFNEVHVWDTNWKVLAENYMESYHLPVCHKGTVGPFTDLANVDCPPGHPHFNIHWFTKEAELAIGNAHPDNTRLTGVMRKTSALISIYPSHMVTLTPGYFWYLCLQPDGVGRVRMIFGGGFDPHFMGDPKAIEYNETLKTILDDVNLEDRGCTEKVYQGLLSRMAAPGHLSHLERPNYDFAQYLSGRIAPAASNQGLNT